MKQMTIRDIRKSWLQNGVLPTPEQKDLLSSAIYRSWQRCISLGLSAHHNVGLSQIIEGPLLQAKIEKNEEFIRLANPTMNYLYGLIAGLGGVVYWQIIRAPSLNQWGILSLLIRQIVSY